MSNAPVYYALAQARFNPVAAMSKYVDQIQDRLRREGYPLFESQQVTHLVVPGPGLALQAEPQVAQAPQWLLTRGDRTAGFILAPSAITYHTTHYDTHNVFIPELLRGLAALKYYCYLTIICKRMLSTYPQRMYLSGLIDYGGWLSDHSASS